MWIGKPLDVVIPVSLDAAEAGGSLCLGAEVLQGDTPILERRVSVSLESGSGGSSSIRVRTTVPVDEPVVTVSVRAGCDMKSTRSYTLLADVPSDVTLPGVAVAGARPSSSEAAPVPRPVPRTTPRAATGSGGTASPDGAAASPSSARRAAARPPQDRERVAEAQPAQAAAPVAPAPRRAAPVVPRAVPTARPAPAAPPKTEVATPGPRLQVEALEPEPAKNTGLKPTAVLAPPPGEDPARRAAAAALWGTMNPAAAEAQRDNQRMKELEATLAALREQTAQNQRALLEMRSELAQARESQFRNPLVYALIAALLLALLGLLLMWRANRRAVASAWWRESTLKEEAAVRPRRLRRHGGLLDDDADPDADPDEPPRKRSLGATTFGTASFAALAADDDEDDAPTPPARAHEGAAVRPVNTEELFDVQQQSDFFLSLGQHDQAIAVLREHIEANPGTSALAYLDLLRIYHSLDRPEDYARLAEEFEHAFNADVPPFDKYTDAGRGLEHYRSTLARIASQWPAPSTLALIEELIFRKPGIHEDGAFDLAAYQELLLLYALAKEVIEPESAPTAAVVMPPTLGDTNPPTATAPIDTPTATAPIWPDTLPPTMTESPLPPFPSIYGTIDERLQHDTVMAPATPLPSLSLPEEEGGTPSRVEPVPELDLAEFDKTAYETMPTPIEPVKAPAPSSDPHVIDFELFDPDTEAEIAPKSVKR